MELSIDTSTRFASVALSQEGRCTLETTWRSSRNHSVELAPTVMALLERAGGSVADLSAVFVARGPGGFSALRVGMSLAKALAVAREIPLVSVPSLDVEAWPYLGLGRPVAAVIGAGRSRLYIGLFEGGQGEGDLGRYTVATRQELADLVGPGRLVCGEAAVEVADALASSGSSAVEVPPPTRRAGVLAFLAYRRLQAGLVDDPDTLQPLYLRSSQISAAERRWTSGRPDAS